MRNSWNKSANKVHRQIGSWTLPSGVSRVVALVLCVDVKAMDSLPNELIVAILQRLDLQHKFRAMRICKRWKQLCEQEVKTHNRLSVGIVCTEPLFPLTPDYQLNDNDVVPDFLVSARFRDCWPSLFKYLSSLVGLYVDCEAGLFLRNLLHFQSHQLTFLICPNWTYAWDQPLPQLVHLVVDSISDASFRYLLLTSPKLASIKFSRTTFRNWELLPRNLKSLTGGELGHNPFDRLLMSPAAESLEYLTLRSPLLQLVGTYQSLSLRRLEVGGFEDLPDNMILNWAETLSSSKQLRHLHFSTPIESVHLSSAILWNAFFASVSSLTSIYLNLRSHRLDPMSQIVSSLVQSCPNLEEITLPYSNICDEDLEAVSGLPFLNKFLLYANSGAVTETGVMALLTNAKNLSYLHINNNYKARTHSPPMTTCTVKQKVDELGIESVFLQYLDEKWKSC